MGIIDGAVGKPLQSLLALGKIRGRYLRMALLKTLESTQEILTPEGKVRLTHEAFCYTITPYAFPPIQVKRVKGYIDGKGVFRPVLPMEAGFEITQDEFRQLISPTPQGKPAGDFRISDVLAIWRKREKPPEAAAGPAADAEKASEEENAAATEIKT
jgi:hypothetical protein